MPKDTQKEIKKGRAIADTAFAIGLKFIVSVYRALLLCCRALEFQELDS
ncbi:MAG: hypothetical protein U9N77_16135 [Thermodesulfobacteriota bacterium]|nr:hypothetical protein [Thermodesulfobacteriota bacterium]